MSTNKDESTSESNCDESSSIECPSQEIDAPPNEIQESSLVKESECIVDSSDSSLNDQATAKANKDLKSILALSKEAKLDTNIAHKRKSINPKAKPTADTNAEDSDKKVFPEDSDDEQASSHKSPHNPKLDSVSDDECNKATIDKERPKLRIGKRKRHSVCDVSLGGADSDHSKRIKKMNQVFIMHNKNKDPFCWVCHHETPEVFCETCPRSYHQKCLKRPASPTNRFLCPECITIMKAENLKQRSPAMQEMSLDHLCGLLKFALKRMMQVGGCEPFINPVNEDEFPEYRTYIVQPMDLICLEKNIKDNVYGSTQAFESDAKWIVHNSIIFNSSQSKLTSVAKSVLKTCKQEMAEIENCASCYLNANTKRKTWFVEVCPKPHLLVWAKLKGFPYWPAKAMRTNSTGMVDVRFFGAHDRAWIPYKECFLFSLKDPNSTNKQKRNDINESIKEVKIYIENLKKVYGELCYAEYKTRFIPGHELEYLQKLLPKYKPDANAKMNINRKSTSRSSLNGTFTPEKLNRSLEKSEETKSTIDSKSRSQDFDKDQDDPKNASIDEPDNGNESNETSSVSSKDSKSSSDSKDSLDGNNIEFSNDSQINDDISDSLRKSTAHSDMPLVFEGFPPRTLSRHDSDSSSSSHISNLSDTINKVDIPENMEIVLGGEEIVTDSLPQLTDDETNDAKRKPVVQVNITLNDNAELTISPSSKSSVTDRLMKKLSQPPSDTEASSSSKQEDENVESPIKSLSTQETKVVDNRISVKNITDLLPKLVNVVKSLEHEQNVTNIDANQATESKQADISICSAITINDKMTEDFFINESDNLKNNQVAVSLNIINDGKSETVFNSNVECDKNESDKVDNDKEVTVSSTSDTVKNSSITLKPNTNNVLNDESIIDNLMKNVEAESNLLAQDKFETKGTNGKRKLSTNATTQDEEIGLPQNKIPKTSSNSGESVIQAKKNELPLKEGRKTLNKSDATIQEKEIGLPSKEIQKRSSNAINSQTTKEPAVFQNSILQTRLSNDINKQPTTTDPNSEIDPLAITIKSEPVSEDEPSDDEYKELKRKYLSALNISEKGKLPLKPRSKLRVDNLSKTINEVATNSCPPASIAEITITKISKKGNAFTKAPSKIQEKQRARKSFPSPKPKPILPYPNVKDTNFNSPPIKDIICYSSKKKDYTKVPKQNIIINKTTTIHKPDNSQIVLNKQVTSSPNLRTVALTPTVTIPVFTKVPQPITSSAPTAVQTKPSNSDSQENRTSTVKGIESQNYIPQSGTTLKNTANTVPTISTENLTPTITTTVPSLAPLTAQPINSTNSDFATELQPLSAIIPPPLGKAITEVMLRGPPKLKPRPPGPLSTQFEEIAPSSIGTITTRVNSISHRLSDYFRGMLIELLHEVGEDVTPEAEIASLKLEIEQLKHKHSEEIWEIKKNISTILKDVQKSILQERNQLIEETRAACEAECLKRVEEAKSKQWCAHCSKEAQFYCCWNTSYCDFNCQQAHWPKHMSKCVQNAEKAQQLHNINSTSNKTSSQQALIRPLSTQKNVMLNKTILGKSTKVVVSKTMKSSYNFSTGSLTFVEAPSGSFELLGNSGPISVGGKFISNIGKVKSGSVVSVTSASTNTSTKASPSGQKVVTKSHKPAPTATNTSINCDDDSD